MPAETKPSSGPPNALPSIEAVLAGPAPAQAFWQNLTHFDSTKLSWPRALRNSIGVVLPLIAGFALQMPRGGLVVASGALNVSYSDGSDPYSERAKRMLASSVICAVAVFAGAISGKHQIFAIVLATAWAFVAGMFVAIGGAAPDLGVISLVTLLIYAAQPLTPRQAAISGALALAGGLFQTALSVAFWPVHRYDPERRALANFYLELANRAATPLNAMSAPLASVHSEQAQEALLGLGSDPHAESLRYRALLSQGERIRLSLLMLSRLRLRTQRENPQHPAIEILNHYLDVAALVLRNISTLLQPATQVRHQKINQDLINALDRLTAQLREQRVPTAPSFLAAVTKEAVFQMEALNGQLRAALDLAGSAAATSVENISPTLRTPSWREQFRGWMEALRANLNLQSPAFRHALRLAVLVAAGDIIGRMVSWRRTYWLPMTVVLVLKPEFTATFTRGLLRIAGTIVGLLLATGLFHMFQLHVPEQIILIFAFVFLLRWLGPANYGIFGIVVSALIVLLLAIGGIPPKDVIWARGINTAAGGILTLLAYRLWPSWERSRISERIAQMLEANRDYIETLAQVRAGDESTLRKLERVRSAARVTRSNLEASIDRLSSEPGTTKEQMSRLNGVLASSHRLVHALMAVDAIFLQSPELSNSAPLRIFASRVASTLTLLAATLRGSRIPLKEFPDLREEYRAMVQARGGASDAAGTQFDSINIEADRITNSVNTMAEQIMHWTRTPEFAALHKLQKNSPAQQMKKSPS
jgi:uncharacterized membrane protein YccC